MALATTISFGSQMLLVGDGASPEQFAAPCGFENLTMSIVINNNDTNIPDCNDPDLPAWLRSDEISRQMRISGQGVLAVEALTTWRDWWLNGGEKNVRWMSTIPSQASLNGYYAAAALLSQYEESGQRGQVWNVSVAVALQGQPTFTQV